MVRPAIRLLAALTVSCLLAACAEPPEKEMTEAREAIETARAAGAERYAPAEYKEATDAAQRSQRFVAERDYRQALSAALDARERAEAAAQAAAAGKETARVEAYAALKDVEAAIGQARSFVEASGERPPRTRPERLHLSEVRRAIVVGNVALQKAREAAGREDYEAVSRATEGVAGRLRAVLAEKPEEAAPRKTKPRR
jgi:hypothetical protein